MSPQSGRSQGEEASPLVHYNPFDPVTQRDPYPAYARLRAESPLYHHAELDFYALSRHADVCAALRDHERFSSSHGVTLELWSPDAARLQGLLAMDPPAHTDLRKVVSGGFTPRRVAELEPMIRALTRQLLDEPLAAGSFDLARWTARIPARVVAELIGVPAHDHERMQRLTETLVSPAGQDEFWSAAADAVTYLGALLDERQRCPRDDLAGVLAGGAGLTDEERVAVLGVVTTAGNESSSKVMTNALVHAWLNQEQRAKAWSGGISGWVEETLRYDGGGQLVARRVTRDTEMYGRVVPAGARMLLLVACANRDDRVFPGGERYDIGRDTGAAIAFGAGRHFCLGASLARLMIRVVLEEFVSAVADYEVDLESGVFALSPNVRGYRELQVSVKPR
ncbi:cytochrome P450 [Nonomuraea sp. NPDC050556]|uniref:cytochrome P450 n=1 Tax=Nonomuraea sp. NPDC050556 TaxID=3364369 RepID=UPI0037A77E2D